MRATRTLNRTPQPYYHRVKTENTGPELEVQKILASLKVPFHTNEWLYTRFNLDHPIKPDAVATRALGNPAHVIVMVHGRFWHEKIRRRKKDEQQRAALEAEGYHVIEIAVGQRANRPFWGAVSNVLKRVLLDGENIRATGRLGYLLALSIDFPETVVIQL